MPFSGAADFRVETFRSDPASVFLCVGQKELDGLPPPIRLVFEQMFTIPREPDRAEADRFHVLFLLGFSSLGKMQGMGRGITTVRPSNTHLL